MAGTEEDNMDDSLFEGMVLFTPNPQAPITALDNHHQSSSSSSLTTTTTTTTTATNKEKNKTTTVEIEEEEDVTTSEPLDEDLFSDLTVVVTPTNSSLNNNNGSSTIIPPMITTTDTPIISSLTRQKSSSSSSSSKRKKKSSFKIGYGRDYYDLSNSTPDLAAFSPSPDSLPLSDAHQAPTPPPKDADFTVLDHNPDLKITTFKPHHDDDDDEESEVSSSAERFDQLKGRINEKLARARESVLSVSSEFKVSVRRRRKAAEDVAEALIRYQEVERELEEACEAEDFERAQLLSDSLASAEKVKAELVLALRVAERECDAVDGKMQRALEFQIATEEECALLLDRFSVCAANDAESVLTKADTESSKEIDDWLSSTEALQLKKLELEIESHVVHEARKVMDSSIETSMEDDVKEKERLSQKKDVLVDELEKLLALVKAKEKEIAENDASIETIEKRIANAVSGFQEAKSSIDATYDNIQSSLSQMELESESLSIKKKEIDDFIINEEHRGTQLKELAKRSSDEAKEYQEIIGLRKILMTPILKSRDDKSRLAMTEEQLSGDVQDLQRKVSAARASLQELSSTKSGVQKNIASFQEKIFSIGKRLPELEAEKKVAATARNFKEAARISAEAKSLTIEKDGLQNDLEKAILQVEKLEGDIKETVNELEETERSILSKEKEVAMARFQKLLLVIGAATAERSAALELGFDEEASLYLAEAKAAETEAMKLKQEYNFEEEMFACLPKHFISMELVSSLGREKLADLEASIKVSAPS